MCSRPDCDSEAMKKSLCDRHYYQWYRSSKKEIDVDDFWNFVKQHLKLKEAK